jgi:hypothetical protein
MRLPENRQSTGLQIVDDGRESSVLASPPSLARLSTLTGSNQDHPPHARSSIPPSGERRGARLYLSATDRAGTDREHDREPYASSETEGLVLSDIDPAQVVP